MFNSKSILWLIGLFLIILGCDSSLTSDSPSKKSTALKADALQQTDHAKQRKALAEVRQGTAPYNNLNKAIADGYVQFSPHVPGMGIHYLHDSNFNNNAEPTLDSNLDRKNPEILVYVEDAPRSNQQRLVAVEYAVPKSSASPPSNALNLFPGLDEHDWHVHPSSHELPIPNTWTIHGECHYQGGIGVFLAENPAGDFVYFTPPTGAFGSWSGSVTPGQCPTSQAGDPLPPLLIAHGKWWTLHAWVWYPNPEGIFHPTNPRLGSGN
ncbi:MAG: hypothetical protein R3211_03780 [Balneolaceae bacterium]|nr:hypothetical protein [Balneolaceae bacterium]